MKRFRWLGIVLATVIMAGFCSCAQQVQSNPSSSVVGASSQESSPRQNTLVSLSDPSPEITAPPAELKEAEVITVYRAYLYTDIFEPTKVTLDKDDLTVLDIIREAEKVLEVKLPILSVTEDRGMVTVNLSHNFTDTYNKREIDAILSTVGMTLRENVKNYNDLIYQIDGETGPFDEWYTLPVLKLIDGTPKEYAAIRAKVPYEGLNSIPNILEYDETGNKIAGFLSRLLPLDKDITSVKELDNQYILLTAIFQTKYYLTESAEGEEERYREVLKPIEGPVSGKLITNGPIEIQYWLKEHLEQSARLIFGEYVTLTHEDLYNYKFKYFDIEGVYTPPHTEVGPHPRPFLLDYKDMGDRYRVKVAYVLESLGYEPPYIDPDTQEGISEAELKDYVKTKCRQREVILRKAEDGSLQFVSHRYLPQ